jgi:hypothetical protein
VERHVNSLENLISCSSSHERVVALYSTWMCPYPTSWRTISLSRIVGIASKYSRAVSSVISIKLRQSNVI